MTMPAIRNSISTLTGFSATIETALFKVKYFITIVMIAISSLYATPTSIFWTNCTTDSVAFGKYRLDVDNFFSMGNRAKNGSSFPTDVGLTAGLIPCKELGGEVGIDYLGGAPHPLYFNGKLSLKENALFDHSPSFSVGLFNVGTTHRTNQCVVDAVIGTTLPKNLGRIFFGLFHGRRALGKHRSGWMAAYQMGFWHKKEERQPEYDKWQFSADYASGKNAIGGGGFALSYFFTPTINLETGPVWFTDTKANGRWKWALQLGIEI